MFLCMFGAECALTDAPASGQLPPQTNLRSGAVACFGSAGFDRIIHVGPPAWLGDLTLYEREVVPRPAAMSYTFRASEAALHYVSYCFFLRSDTPAHQRLPGPAGWAGAGGPFVIRRRCEFDQAELKVGDSLWERIDEGLRDPPRRRK